MIASLATLAAWYVGLLLFRRWPSVWLHPLATSVVALGVLLRVSGLSPERYAEDAKWMGHALSPCIVALAVGLHERRALLARYRSAILLSLTAGAAAGAFSAVALARGLGLDPVTVASLAPKSATTAIAAQVARQTGGRVDIASVVVLFVGLGGALVGPAWMRALGVRSKLAQGLAMGAAAHGVGTAEAVRMGPEEGAASALALGLHGLLTAVVAPWAVRWWGR